MQVRRVDNNAVVVGLGILLSRARERGVLAESKGCRMVRRSVDGVCGCDG